MQPKGILCCAIMGLFFAGSANNQGSLSKPLQSGRTLSLSTCGISKEEFSYVTHGNLIKITFTPVAGRSGDLHWSIDVGEPYRYNVPKRQDRKNMGSVISLCSQKQYIFLLDNSLTHFHTVHPNANIQNMTLGAYTVRELWQAIRLDMRRKLAHVPGKKITMHNPKNDNLNEPPIATWTAPNDTLQKSQVIAATRRVFLKHELQIGAVRLGTEFWFKEALNGYTWNYISKLPDVGIATPGTIEFTLHQQNQILKTKM